MAWTPPRAAADQLTACTDVLARLGPVSSRPYDYLLTWLARRAPAGATILALTSRDPGPVLPVLRRLASVGFDVEVVALGPNGALAAETARLHGLRGRAAELRPDWEHADVLTVAG